jgi:alkyl sulfatase BDS1-like metallo-beta-lactamase superfamily hydrolase
VPAGPARCVALAFVIGVLGCGGKEPTRTSATAATPLAADAQGRTDPTPRTQAANAGVAKALPLADPQDFTDVRRGLVAGEGDVVITAADGRVVWDTRRYGFVAGDAPASVNPSLWRQAKLNDVHGLFEVAPGIHQVRGYDLANLSIIDGKTGWILVDPLGSAETSAAAIALARKALGEKPIVAVVFTHSHVDHFGGVAGVLPDDAVRASTRIVAPKGFIEEATSENVLAGLAMGRRATFMYGTNLDRSPRGHVDTGLGKEPSLGRLSIAVPTDLVDHTPQAMEIDGVRFVFQYAPASEAPAELTFYLPDAKAWCGAEIVSHTMHNLYTLRGAKVRDALRWSGYIDEALDLFGDADVVFISHHWPVWGNDRVRTFLAQQRDAYRYVHDQTLRLANAGATPNEIAEQIELPASLRTVFPLRDYYGTVRHNAKAVYQNYFGWYDGNPAHLNPLPPEDAAPRYVEAMGGATAVRERARAAFDAGDYRWAAMLLDHLVFAEPNDTEARTLLAGVYDQLGYEAESGPWRDAYLTGALELRRGVQSGGPDATTIADLLLHLPLDVFFASLAARLDGPSAEGKTTRINMVFTDTNESWVLWLENSVLHAKRRDADPAAAATVKLTRPMLVRLVTNQVGLSEIVTSNDLAVDGSRLELIGFLRLLDRPGKPFAIVEP